jgi:predicted AAA+ superfamily ATPase
MNKNKLKTTIIEQNENFCRYEAFIDRKIEKDFIDNPKISIISGVRRSGKSTMLKQIAQDLLKYYYLNFEDERLLDFQTKDFNSVLEIFYELYGVGGVFLFDEIQEVPAWEKFVRRLYEEKAKIFITGSNAKLLSSELSSSLSGRHIKKELFPFSFREYLQYEGFEIKKNLTAKDQAKLAAKLREYAQWGGFPEVLKSRYPEELQQLYQDILIKDLLVRFKIRETKTFREIALYLLSNSASPISFNNLAKLLGVKSVATVKNYVDFFEEAYLFFSLYKFDYSIKKQIKNDRKTYAIDTGLINAVSFKFSENTGHILENLIYLELRRSGQDIYYHFDKKECDFLVRKGNRVQAAIQVAYSLAQPASREREIAGLTEAMTAHNLRQGLIITFDEEDELKIGKLKINIVPAWKWLLGN